MQRFDLSSRSFLAPWIVGASLSGIDITPDAAHLYVGETWIGPSFGLVRKIDLATGKVANIDFPRQFGLDTGVQDLTILNHQRGLFAQDLGGSGAAPVYELDLSTDTPQVADQIPELNPRTEIFRSADRNAALVVGESAPYAVYRYDSQTGEFSSHLQGVFKPAAVNRDASRFVLGSAGSLAVFDGDFNPIDVLPPHYGGVVFDPVRPRLYTVNATTDEIVAYDTGALQELFRIPVNQNVENYSSNPVVPNLVVFSASPDGQMLFLSTPTGIRTIVLSAPSNHEVNVAGSDVRNVDFGVAPHHGKLPESAIRGVKWRDDDADGVYEPADGEEPVANHTVYLDLNRNGAFDAGEPFRETDADGRYAFENLPPGDYAVADAAAASWTPTYPVFAGAENQLIAAAARRDFVYEPQRGILYIRKMEKGTFYFSAGK